MKQSLLYLHGGSAYSDYQKYVEWLQSTPVSLLPEEKKRWPATLQTELADYYQLCAPPMPNKYNAKYDEWKIWFERHYALLEGPVTLVGWSLGGMFLLKYFSEEKAVTMPNALHLVATPVEQVEFNGEDGGDFLFNLKDTEKWSKEVSSIHIHHSKDDFVVPFEHAEKLAAQLPQATLHTYERYNHFLIESFPELIALLREAVE